MKITVKMIHEMNAILANDGAIFRVRLGDGTGGNPNATIVPANNKYLDSCVVNLTNEFFEFLEDFFEEKGIQLQYNNTRNTFWSKSGWEGLL